MTEKFPHLANIEPNAKSIVNLRPEDIKEEHLGTLRILMDEFSSNSNGEIVEAANIIIGKIDNIMNLGNTRFSGEIMNAANDKNYSKAA